MLVSLVRQSGLVLGMNRAIILCRMEYVVDRANESFESPTAHFIATSSDSTQPKVQTSGLMRQTGAERIERNTKCIPITISNTIYTVARYSTYR